MKRKRIGIYLITFLIMLIVYIINVKYGGVFWNWLYSKQEKMDRALFNIIAIFLMGILGIIICFSVGSFLDKIKGEVIGEKVPFAEKHPRLNLIIAFLLLGIMVDIVWAIIYYILQGITDIFKWLAGMASKMDAVVIVALITGMVSIIGVIISSIVSKIIEYRKGRQNYLAQKREEPYAEFVDMIYKLQQYSKNKDSYNEQMMVEDLSKFSKKITLWGSSNVVNKWVKFRENGTNPEAAVANVFLMEEIMNEMRKDLGLKKVKKGKLLAFFVNDIKSVIKIAKK